MSAPQIEVREASDGDWLEVFLDGKQVIRGHSASTYEWMDLLVKVGAAVTEAKGDFCSSCGDWYTGQSCCVDEEEESDG